MDNNTVTQLSTEDPRIVFKDNCRKWKYMCTYIDTDKKVKRGPEQKETSAQGSWTFSSYFVCDPFLMPH